MLAFLRASSVQHRRSHQSCERQACSPAKGVEPSEGSNPPVGARVTWQGFGGLRSPVAFGILNPSCEGAGEPGPSEWRKALAAIRRYHLPAQRRGRHRGPEGTLSEDPALRIVGYLFSRPRGSLSPRTGHAVVVHARPRRCWLDEEAQADLTGCSLHVRRHQVPPSILDRRRRDPAHGREWLLRRRSKVLRPVRGGEWHAARVARRFA